MDSSISFVIRDGLESDIDACLNLDHDYQTDHVWQMRMLQNTGEWQITFTTERLPRTLDVVYPVHRKRIERAIPDNHCFLVAASKDEPAILAYLVMHHEPVYQVGWIQDVVISRIYRRQRIGTRLINVAQRWAAEKGIVQLTAEIPTKNVPGIQFFQNRGFSFCGFNDQYFANRDIAVFFSKAMR